MFNNISKTGVFFLGALAGIAVVAMLKSKTVQRGCAKIVAAGKQLKDEAQSFVETVKEDAEDIAEEVKQENKTE
ncbi:MAG: YtxH domain-containing protein [Bacteroidales bacterium]|nr:YtxH domain-containing protein [Bacteroidales bacterium]